MFAKLTNNLIVSHNPWPCVPHLAWLHSWAARLSPLIRWELVTFIVTFVVLIHPSIRISTLHFLVISRAIFWTIYSLLRLILKYWTRSQLAELECQVENSNQRSPLLQVKLSLSLLIRAKLSLLLSNQKSSLSDEKSTVLAGDGVLQQKCWTLVSLLLLLHLLPLCQGPRPCTTFLHWWDPY